MKAWDYTVSGAFGILYWDMWLSWVSRSRLVNRRNWPFSQRITSTFCPINNQCKLSSLIHSQIVSRSTPKKSDNFKDTSWLYSMSPPFVICALGSCAALDPRSVLLKLHYSCSLKHVWFLTSSRLGPWVSICVRTHMEEWDLRWSDPKIWKCLLLYGSKIITD